MSDHIKAVIIGFKWINMEFWTACGQKYDRPSNLSTPYLVIRGLTVAIIIATYLILNEQKTFCECNQNR